MSIFLGLAGTSRVSPIATIRRIVFTALLAALAACAPKAKVFVPAPTGNWISLFNGKNQAPETMRKEPADPATASRNLR
ncbi:MAG: hypothetical protein QOD95_3619 [Gammaproteobacteria bacterium]|jgi:hypothetical protein|nr:hypothetical protein [Gammaproteobacteria bacterium]